MTRNPRLDTLTLALGAAVAGAALSGCMASPADGMIVANTSQTLHFNGFHPHARAPVRVKAYNFSARRYDVIASGVSTSSPIPAAYWDDTLYEWWAPSRSLPSAYWSPARCTGARALLKGETDVGGSTYGMYSWDLEKNAEGCTTEHRNNSDWVQHCAASQSEITTRDYRDEARPFGLQVNAAFNTDGACDSIVFYYSYPRGEWSDVWANYRQGNLTRGLTCTDTRSTSTRTYGSCRIQLGSPSAVRSFIEWHQRNDGRLIMSARDTSCRERVTASRHFTMRASTYDYNWSRWAPSECIAPPPPPPTVDLRWHDISCFCTDVAGGRAQVDIRGCMNASASSPATGASLLCSGPLVNALERSGVDHTCWYLSHASSSSSCSVDGQITIVP